MGDLHDIKLDFLAVSIAVLDLVTDQEVITYRRTGNANIVHRSVSDDAWIQEPILLTGFDQLASSIVVPDIFQYRSRHFAFNDFHRIEEQITAVGIFIKSVDGVIRRILIVKLSTPGASGQALNGLDALGSNLVINTAVDNFVLHQRVVRDAIKGRIEELKCPVCAITGHVYGMHTGKRFKSSLDV